MKRLVGDARGFTLAELLIVVAVLGFMMGALFTLQRQGQLAYLTGAARVEVQQNARVALDMMVNDLRAAQPVTGSVTRVLTSIDANCTSGPPPTGAGGTSLAFTDQFSKTVTYQMSGTDLQRVYNGTTEVLVGGVQEFVVERGFSHARLTTGCLGAAVRLGFQDMETAKVSPDLKNVREDRFTGDLFKRLFL